MYKKNITYTDFNGDERTDAFYFNLSDAEILELQVSYGGDMSRIMSNMLEKRDAKGLLGIITDLIQTSYGEKSSDGKRFMKNQEIKDSFITTDAYSKLVLELLNDEKEFEKFMTNVIPSAKREALNEMIRKREQSITDDDENDDKVVDIKKG
jgi:hypothetical protein